MWDVISEWPLAATANVNWELYKITKTKFKGG